MDHHHARRLAMLRCHDVRHRVDLRCHQFSRRNQLAPHTDWHGVVDAKEKA
jgi:hypothetical protein